MLVINILSFSIGLFVLGSRQSWIVKGFLLFSAKSSVDDVLSDRRGHTNGGGGGKKCSNVGQMHVVLWKEKNQNGSKILVNAFLCRLSPPTQWTITWRLRFILFPWNEHARRYTTIMLQDRPTIVIYIYRCVIILYCGCYQIRRKVAAVAIVAMT